MAVNPKGYVPALRLDDGSILTEGPAIVQYLADSKPASGLAPAAGAIDRYRLQNWLTFIGTELHKSFSPLFNRASSDDVQLAGRESTYHRNYRFKRHSRAGWPRLYKRMHGRRHERPICYSECSPSRYLRRTNETRYACSLRD